MFACSKQRNGKRNDRIIVDSHQISLDASQMLRMLDLVSLARLVGCER